MKKISTYIICLAVIGTFFSGCAAFKEKKEERELITVPTGKKDIMLLAKKYEEERQFKKALNALKEARKLDPDDRELEARVEKLGTGLDSAVSERLKKGEYYFRQGDLAKARKEFLLVLFLDPEQHAALNYLRRLSDVPAPGKVKKEWIQPDIKTKGYTIHTLQKGESLSMLARIYYGDRMKYGIIAGFNNIKDINRVFVGQKIKIPILENGKPLKDKEKKAEVRGPEKPVETGKHEIGKEKAGLAGEVKEEETWDEPEYPEEELPERPPAPEAAQTAGLDYEYSEKTFKMAEKLFLEEKFSEAIEAYQKVLQERPDHPFAAAALETSKKIVTHLKKGHDLYSARKYGKAYDEFSKVLDLKPDSAVAVKNMEKLVPPMITEATYLLYDEQSPCEAIVLIEKILKKEPENQDAQELLDEATTLEQGLELHCGNN